MGVREGPGDGWQRWGIVFPQHVMAGEDGIDGLTIQQTASAIATHGTLLIGIDDRLPDGRQMETNNVGLVVDRGAAGYVPEDIPSITAR